MKVQPSCPVCGISDVKPVYDPVLLPKQREAVPIIGYRCDNNHLFLPPEAVPAGQED